MQWLCRSLQITLKNHVKVTIHAKLRNLLDWLPITEGILENIIHVLDWKQDGKSLLIIHNQKCWSNCLVLLPIWLRKL